MSSAEGIAKVVSDINAGRANPLDRNHLQEHAETYQLSRQLFNLNTFMPGSVEVVDSTLLYQNMKDKDVALYEDHQIAAPWRYAMIGYENEFENIKVMATVVVDLENPYSGQEFREDHQWQPKNQEHIINWDETRWVYLVLAFIGGRSKQANRTIPTIGPCYGWQIAVAKTGDIQDIQWSAIDNDSKSEDWLTCITVLIRTLHFATATNVVLVEPHRPRAERRRIERHGYAVKTIHVLPTGKTRKHLFDDTVKGTVPLTSVRGHFANYGPEYNRGLLFGKYSGRFWIPQHARGSEEAGKIEHRYEINP